MSADVERLVAQAKAQGHPETVLDASTLATIAAIVRGAGRPPKAVRHDDDAA